MKITTTKYDRALFHTRETPAPDLGGLGQFGARASGANRRRAQILNSFFFSLSYRGANIILCPGRRIICI